jgi:hypothetical protein
VPVAISVGGVDQRDAEVERVANEVDAVAVVTGAVDIGQRHATEADRRDLRRSEPALFRNAMIAHPAVSSMRA